LNKHHLNYIINLKSHWKKKQRIINEKPQGLFINSATALGVAKKLMENGEFLAMVDDEAFMLDGIDKKETMLDLLIKCYEGKKYTHISCNAHSHIELDNPNLNVMIAVQREIALSFLSHEKLINLGLAP
jgi:hypothetical protein